jgi:hypothetical protein
VGGYWRHHEGSSETRLYVPLIRRTGTGKDSNILTRINLTITFVFVKTI